MIIAEDGTELYLSPGVHIRGLCLVSYQEKVSQCPWLRPEMRNGGINRHNKVGE